MRILIAGGGTGGHIYPAIAIAETFSRRNIFVDLACTQRKIDRIIIEQNRKIFDRIIFQPIEPPNKSIKGAMRFTKSLIQTQKLLKDYLNNDPPQLIIGLGGFGSLPSLLEAKKRKIKTVIISPDLIPGKANKIAQFVADKILVQWRQSQSFFRKKVTVVKIPLRKLIRNLPQKKELVSKIAHRSIGLNPQKKKLVIVGGSSGARTLNFATLEAIKKIYTEIQNEWQIIHITGINDFDAVKEAYSGLNSNIGDGIKVFPYCDKIALLWSVADLAISRAGAITIAELTHCRIPTIFLPYPFHRDKHQLYNAKVLASEGAAIIIEDDVKVPANTVNALKDILLDLTKNTDKLLSIKSILGKIDSRPDGIEEIQRYIRGI